MIRAPARPIPDADIDRLSDDQLMNVLAHFKPPGYSSVGLVNTVRWRPRRSRRPNGQGTATGLARLYAAPLAAAAPPLSADLLRQATAPQSVGPCPILGEEMPFGLGLMPTSKRRPLGPNPGASAISGPGACSASPIPTPVWRSAT